MAVTAVELQEPSNPGPRKGFYVDARIACRVFALTKLTGDTTYTLVTGLDSIQAVQIADAANAAITAATWTDTPGTPGSLNLAVLGAGLLVYVYVRGTRGQNT